jgi:hypothetical protein
VAVQRAFPERRLGLPVIETDEDRHHRQGVVNHRRGLCGGWTDAARQVPQSPTALKAAYQAIIKRLKCSLYSWPAILPVCRIHASSHAGSPSGSWLL